MNNEDSAIKESEINSLPELTLPPVKEKRSNFLVLILLTVTALCVLGIIVINTMDSLAPGNYIFSETSVSTFHTADGKTLLVFRDGNKTSTVEVENVICSAACNHGYVEEYVNSAFTTLDVYSKVLLCLDSENSKLSVITAKDGEINIASKVNSAQMDEYGNRIFYVDSEGNLNSYNVKSHKTKLIDTGVASCSVISPSGKSLIYKKENGDLYLSTNGKTGKNFNIHGCYSIFSVTDDGETVYYLEKIDGAFNVSVYTDGKSTALISNFDLTKAFSAFLNRDKTDIILSYDSETYVTHNRTELKKICDGNLVLPMKPEIASREQGIPFVETYADTMITVSNENGEFELVHVTENLTGEYVNGISGLVRITNDGRYVYGLSDDSLVCVDISDGHKTETVATDVSSYTISYDGEDIYYTDTDGALWHMHNEKTQKIASACKEFCIDRDGTLYFTGAMGDGETLYSSRFGSSPEKIETGESVFSLFSFGGYAYFTSYTGNEALTLFSVNRGEYHKVFDKIIY